MQKQQLNEQELGKVRSKFYLRFWAQGNNNTLEMFKKKKGGGEWTKKQNEIKKKKKTPQ